MTVEGAREIVGDLVEVGRQELGGEVPGRNLGRPWHAVRLVGSDQHAGALLAHVELAIEVDAVDDLLAGRLVEGDDFGQLFGQQVLVRHAQHRQLQSDKAADLAGPQSAGVHDVLGMDAALLGDDVPAAVGALYRIGDAALLNHLGAVGARRLGIGVGGAGRIEMALERVPHGADELRLVEEGEVRLRLLEGDELGGDAEIAVAGMRHLQPVEPVAGGYEHDAARQVHARRLAGHLLDLAIEIDRVFLELRDVGVAVERVKAAGGVPRGPRGQHVPLDEKDVADAALRQVVEDRTSDDAAADDNDPGMAAHG